MDETSKESNDDKYIIINEIKNGSFGKIYKVKMDSEFYAVKFINDNSLDFLLEYYIMNNVNNKFINKAIEIITDEFGNSQIIQKLAYSDASDIFKKRKILLSLNNLKKISWQIICGIACLHSKGILHGDIKSSNILCYFKDDFNLSKLKIKITDFSLSVLILNPEIGTRNYNIKSYTITYRPLEVLKGKVFSFSADIWALGCTLYEIAYNFNLFPVQNNFESYILCIQNFDKYIYGENIKNKNCIPFCQKGWGQKDMYEFNNLLINMLKIQPQDRLTIWQIINDSFFDDVRNIDDLPINLSFPIFNFSNFPVDINKLSLYSGDLQIVQFASYLNIVKKIPIKNAVFIAYKFLYSKIPDKKYTYKDFQEELFICKNENYNFYPNIF